MSEKRDLESLGEHIFSSLEGSLESFCVSKGELTLFGKACDLLKIVIFLKKKCAFIAFVDACAVDYPEREKRFEIVYHFLSPSRLQRVRLKISVDSETKVDSILPIFRGSDWFEREIYDLYGVVFIGHPDLRRILTDYGFEGHPLRKDFPATGFLELRYDEATQGVVYEKVVLPQEFRRFDFLSPWEGAFPEQNASGENEADS